MEAAIQTGAASLGRILVADDDPPFRLGLRQCLERAGFAVDCAGTAAEAGERLRTREFDVLLSDINMPGNTCLELVENIPAFNEGLPVILLTGDPSVTTAAHSVRLHVSAYLTKPPNVEELCHLLHLAVAERRDLRRLKDSRQRIQEWDRDLERLQRLLQQPAASDRPATMRSYVRLMLRQLVVGLVELEHLLIHDGKQLGTDQAVELQEMRKALHKTVAVLQSTKEHFKSKELGELRKELDALLK